MTDFIPDYGPLAVVLAAGGFALAAATAQAAAQAAAGPYRTCGLIGVAFAGMALFAPGAFGQIGDRMMTAIWSSSANWTLTALPLFIWMGEILFRIRLSEDLFKGLAPWMNRLPGRLLHTNIIGCTIFAAISGSSAATVATVGKMSIPELRSRKFPEDLVIGTLSGAGTLGLSIPPPIGFNLFVLQGMTGHNIGYIAKVSLPLFLAMVLAVFLIVVFPDIVMFLPDSMARSAG